MYNTLIDATILETGSATKCVNCLLGAAGTYGFVKSSTDDDTRQWPVCKPIPVIEYPAPPGGGAAQTYRTFSHLFKKPCP
ncbi:hypothetical protein [Streptomyces sp. G45]|uniref:hypothetical protein n=1 Tax=Streptomyces sp. G45 TaxID=3406627 RepID=UPI003C22732D